MSRYIIKRFNVTLQRTEYLYRIRPTRWIDERYLGLRMDKETTTTQSEWLNIIHQPHEVEEWTEP